MVVTTKENTMNRVYGYLRASTKEQDATRAKEALELFAMDHDIAVSAWFTENESGTTLNRPQLFTLLNVAQAGDILLVEQVDRISRLNTEDWNKLKSIILEKGILVVSLDLPTSHQFMQPSKDDFTTRMLSAINSMLLDMLAAVARKDYEDRRRRQREGIKRAYAEGRRVGRTADMARRKRIQSLLAEGRTITEVAEIVGCCANTVSVARRAMNAGL